MKPGARPSSVRLEDAGARSLSIDSSGALLIDTELGVLRDAAIVRLLSLDSRQAAHLSRKAVPPW